MATTEPATDQNHQSKQETDDINTNSTDELEKHDDDEEQDEEQIKLETKAITNETTEIKSPIKSQKEGEEVEEDEDLEEGELKDDDDDEDDDDDDNLLEDTNKSLPGYNNNISNNNTNHNDSNNNINDNLPQSSSNHQPHHQLGPPGAGYPRGGPGGVGPMHKVNIRCRFYSKTSNKCTWGDHCRFEHRDDSPGPEFDGRPQPPPGSSRGVVQPPLGPHMGVPEMGGPIYPPYAGRHQPYPSPQPPGAGPMGPAERCPPYSPYAGRHHQPYLPPPMPGAPMGPADRGHPYPPYPTRHHQPYHQTPPPAGGGGAPSPNYPSPSSSSSSVVYERKHRLAYELAPWNDSRSYPPPSGKYDRGDPGHYPGGRGFYRNHYSGRELPYGREPMPSHIGGPPHPSYQNYPSAYGGGPMEPHASHYNKYMGSSQRNMPSDTRRSRSNKRGHEEDESSWSDSGSEDSILGQSNYSNRNKANKQAHHHHHMHQQSHSHHSQSQQSQTTTGHQPSSQNANENDTYDEPPEQGSGTPPGEPLPEDKERQEMLLNKLKEIEDLMAKKKGEQEDPKV